MRRSGAMMTAAATTGPARGPRPASSTPATRTTPVRQAWASKRYGAVGGGVTGRAFDLLLAQCRGDLPDPLLTHAGGLTGQLPQIVELRAPHAAPPHDVHPLDARRVQGERALHTHPVGDAAHREGRLGSLSPPPDHHAFEDLGPLLLALHDFDVHADRVPGIEAVAVLLELPCFHQPNRIHDCRPLVRF